ncbi:MAG TPA: DUF3341 domain-containing protein [Gemmatimonadaceae bacterium]|nr:DUF3341 domain-containing protein [Gemmatimonadaceae bacterium]
MRRDRERTRLMGEFSSAESLLDAVRRLRAAGYDRVETFAPFDIPGLGKTLGLGRSFLPFFIFASGVVGLIVAYGIQWYANTWDYPLIVGNRPLHPVLAYIPATFEGTVLLAALGAFLGLLLWLRLPKLWDPVFEIEGFERATIDRFWVAVDGAAVGADADRGARVMNEAGALRVVFVERAR